MGTGDYICVTLRGGAPWGFTLREGEGDTYRPFIVTQVDEDGRAFLAGVREDDEAVSLNGEPCADLTLLQALELIDTSIDCVQLLVKRYSTISSDGSESQISCGERDSPDVGLESTTLHIISSKQRPQSPRELFISESQDEVSCGELDSEAEFPKRPQLLSTELHAPSCGNQRVQEENDDDAQRCLSPGDMVELQVSLSEQTLDNRDSTSLGCAIGIEGGLSNREAIITIPATTSHSVQSAAREPLGQRGVVLSSPSLLGQVEVILQQPAASGAGRDNPFVGGPKDGGSAGSQSEGEEGGGHIEGVPGSLTVSFRIPSEEGTAGEEQDSDSEGDQDKPNKHRARHARLRRSESQSEKQLKEAKSKCKRIALLLTAAPPNPNNKGVLMFKKHRQRAKKYTLVSYGTGEDEPEFSDEEDEDNEDYKQGTHTVEFTLLAPDDSEIDKQFISDAQGGKSALTINWDKGLLEIERNLKNQAEMECLPETRGKGAMMFAQRRLRMDEISAEHEELRRHGIPVEGVLETEKKVAEQSYMQSATESHAYMDVNMHQQSQQQQQYQQYQEQQYYEQQQNYQQQQQNYQHQQYQQQQQQYQQQYQQQQYEQQQYQQQQMYQQRQQEYHQEQQQMQHYATNVNGNVQHQTVEMQSSFSNRTAKPFSAEQMVCNPYSPAVSGTNQEAMGQGEQIASRDERISTPAIKTGFLMDARKRNVGKPMFTFKETPKVSPNPALLNLLNKGDKKLGFESGPEEDYLSLGAEACNFLQSSRFKPKIPPPVAPKPVINPNSPPWSPQTEMTNPDMPQQAENSVSTPAAAPTAQTALAPELEPTPAPAPEPSPPPAPQEAPTSTTTEEQPTWMHQPESQQQPMQVPTQEENGQTNPTQPEPAPMTSWSAAQTQPQQEQPTNAWHATQVQPQEPPPNQSPPQPPWVTRQPPQPQAQVQPPTNTWNSQMQPSWGQSPEQAQAPTQAQPPWVQPQEPPHSQPQYQPPWAQTHEQANLQQMQPPWGQPQEPMRQQPQAPWAQAPQTDSQPQPPWVTQQQQKPQPPWAQQVQPESQPQPPWVQQPQQQTPQQAWPQAQAPGQPQPPWASAQPQQQPQSPMSAWPPSQNQAQVQPPWIQTTQAPPPPQPQTNLNPWAPVLPQADPQPSWAQPPPEHGQHPMNSWSQEQNAVQQQPPWAQSVQNQVAPQSNWQQSPSKSPPQPPMNTWPSAQTQPQTPGSAWAPQIQTQQAPGNATSTLNPRPSPKPWNPTQNSPQSRTPPPPPQRIHSFTIGQRVSSPVNPMATVLLSSSQGPAFEMPVVRGKGADMFAKRQSRMEKFVVDSETVEANKASRSTSPVASLPNEWKYTPNVRAPPPRAYNPIQSPSYPPAATKQPPPGSPSAKSKKKGKEKPAPPPKQLNVIDVMKHQPYQLDSSLFLFGPAAEAAKAAAAAKAECPPPNPPVETQPFQYEQMAPVQQPGPYNAPYPQQAYGMPMQPMMHEGHYQQNPANAYPPPNPYQQPPGVPYQQMYNQQYQQPPPPPYQPQSPQSPNPPYQQAPYQQPNNSPYQQASQAPYQPAQSPPYLAAPSVPYHQQPPTSFVAPSFPIAARPESASGGNPTTAPKPKFTAKKSSAQTLGRSYSLSPLARVPAATGQRSASSSPKPPSRASSTPPVRQTHSLEKGLKLPSPWVAASRHPLGLVDEAFPDPQNLQQSLASSIRMAAQRKILPEPPAEWKARVSYQAPPKTGSQTWGQSRGQRSQAQLPSFMSPTKSTASSPAGSAGYRSLPRQWQPQRSVTEGYIGPSGSHSEYKRPLGNQSYKSVYSSNTWSWKR